MCDMKHGRARPFTEARICRFHDPISPGHSWQFNHSMNVPIGEMWIEFDGRDCVMRISFLWDKAQIAHLFLMEHPSHSSRATLLDRPSRLANWLQPRHEVRADSR
jgi:hypothetical protein